MEEPTNKQVSESGQPASVDQDFEEFEIAETELIDAYVQNELSADERELVEKGLRRSPQLVERLYVARMLAKASPSAHGFVSPLVERETLTDRTPIEPVKISWWESFFPAPWAPRPAFSVALAASVILVLLGGVGLLVGWMKLRDESNRLARERAVVEQQRQELEKRLAEQQITKEQLAAELQRVREQRETPEKTPGDLKPRPNDQINPPTFIAQIFTLLPSSRAGGQNEISLSPATPEIRLDLSLDSVDYQRYRVIIKSATGRKIRDVRLGRPQSSSHLSILVPARRLQQGDYQVHVSGVTSSGALEPVEDYSFRVTEKKE